MMQLWRKTRGWRLPFIGLIGFVFALVSVLGRAEAPPREPLQMPAVSPYAHSIAGIGVVEPHSEMVSVGVELPGIVRTLHVQVGDQVALGDPLFTLDQRDIVAHIETLKASLQVLTVQAQEAAAQFKLVQGVSDSRAVSKDDYNRRNYAVALSQARIAELKAQLHQALTTQDRLTVTAPMAGTILDVNIRPGEFAALGALAQPLIRMGDVSTLHVRVEFDEEHAAKVLSHASAQAVNRGDTAQTYPLSFVRLEPYVAPKTNLAVAGQRVDTRVVQVIYALPPNTQLFTGQQLDVYVQHAGQPS